MPINSNTTFIPTIWSARINANLNKNLVLANLVNMDYSGDVKYGNAVKINRPARVAAVDYDVTVAITYPQTTAASLTLNIDTFKVAPFHVEDLDAVQSNVNLLETYAQEAAYALADKIDQSISALYTAQGAGDVAITLAGGDMYAAVVIAGKNLTLKNVPTVGRWLVVSPAGYASLLTSSKFAQPTALGDAVIRTGVVGQVAGFDVYVSNNLVNPGTTVFKYLYGSSRAITHARSLENVESFRQRDFIGTDVRAMVAFGNKVIEPNALGTISATE